jgi:hypothetical protein
MYDPTVGRFLQEDPIGIEGGDPNFYRYCGNSPLTHTDPSGLGPVGPNYDPNDPNNQMPNPLHLPPNSDCPGGAPNNKKRDDDNPWSALGKIDGIYPLPPRQPHIGMEIVDLTNDLLRRAFGPNAPQIPDYTPVIGPPLGPLMPGGMTPAERAAADQFFKNPMRGPEPPRFLVHAEGEIFGYVTPFAGGPEA